MVASPLRVLKDRLTAAIDWRAREAARVDEAVVNQLGTVVADLSAEMSRQLSSLSASIDELARRIDSLERDSRGR